MGRTITFSKVIRGVEVEVEASQFDGDDSVGIPIGPECVTATGPDGEDFPLTDAEVESLGIEAAECYYNDDESDFNGGGSSYGDFTV